MTRRLTMSLVTAAVVAFSLATAVAQEQPAAVPVIENEGAASVGLQNEMAPAGPTALDEAESAYLAADFERARRIAEDEVVRLSALPPAPERDAAQARALGLVVQALYNLGIKESLQETIDRMLAALPTYQLDPAIAGPKLVDLVESRRRAIVGRLVVSCEPLACEEVLVDGRAAPLDDQGRFVVLTGTHTLTLRRHGFDESVIEEVAVTAGQEIDLTAQLVQIARDLRIASEPGGVEVRLDGEVVGVTPDTADAETRVLEVLDVAPGPHVLELRKECFRKLEQKVDIVLDALEPGPFNLGSITLSPARGVVDLAWDRPQGVITIDGSPVDPGRHELCPGPHEASVTLAGRRVWFERFDITEGATASFAPAPRPTIAYFDAEDRPATSASAAVHAAWNVLDGASAGEIEAGRLFVERIRNALDLDPPPLRPGRRVAPERKLTDAARDLAPEADLVAVIVRLDAGARPARALVLVDPELGLVETSAWPAGDDGAEDAIATVLSPALINAVPYVGLDLADRRNGPPVVARVDPGGPAARAGIVPGAIVQAASGAPLPLAADFESLVAALEPPARLAMRIAGAEGVRDISLDVEANLAVTTPSRWRERFLLPTLARARLDRSAGTGAERLVGSLVSGMVLAALGSAEPAALALDRAGIDPSLDPSGDVRGTVLFVLERLFERLGNAEYAQEVRARRLALEGARYGGRHGPDLRHALSIVPAE